MVATSLGLMAHHAFGCWHGDRRLADKYGEAFDKVRGVCLCACMCAWQQRGSWQDRAQRAHAFNKRGVRCGAGAAVRPHPTCRSPWRRALSLGD